MSSRRPERVGGLLRQALGTLLLRDTKDPRLQGVIVTDVDMSPDLRQARVYYRLLAGAAQADAQGALERAAGYLQGVVGRELRLRYTPGLQFVFDPAPDRARRVDELLETRPEDAPGVEEDLLDGARRHPSRR
jgi:ribosome-binding factor A